jgi:hypothetical protein
MDGENKMELDLSDIHPAQPFLKNAYPRYQDTYEIFAGACRKSDNEISLFTVEKPRFLPDWYSKDLNTDRPEAVAITITHESIHAILDFLIGEKASDQFDNLCYPQKLALGCLLERF